MAVAFAIHGLAGAGGIAIGRAVALGAGRDEISRERIAPERVAAELARLQAARAAAVADLERLRAEVPSEAPAELAALLEVHLLLLQDDTLMDGVRRWIAEEHCNAAWALESELDALRRQFDAMSDSYLRERKPDIEQAMGRVLRQLRTTTRALMPAAPDAEADDAPVALAHDLSPADLLQLRKNGFAGIVVDVGGPASHTAILARGMGLPAVVGAHAALRLVRAGDVLVVDGAAGVVTVNPPSAVLAEYRTRRAGEAAARGALARLSATPAVTRDGVAVALLANIERPGDIAPALAAGARGVGLFRTEFLFMAPDAPAPGEEAQYRSYRRAVDALRGLPLTIRTADLGADKPPGGVLAAAAHNPALGLRGVRRSLREPEAFLAQLRALLRAAAHGPLDILVPMLTTAGEIRRTLALVQEARAQLAARRVPCGTVRVGAMIEVPAAALALRLFLQAFDFISVGTNDLIQYTLAVDRTDEEVAPLFDPWHPAVVGLLEQVIGSANAAGKEVTICGELAGDPAWTELLLGLGLRRFSMQPTRIGAVKQRVLAADASALAPWSRTVIASDDPGQAARTAPRPPAACAA